VRRIGKNGGKQKEVDVDAREAVIVAKIVVPGKARRIGVDLAVGVGGIYLQGHLISY